MNKIPFKNNQEPALNETNLNLLQDNMEKAGVIVSTTEPTTGEKVWIQKGKNLVNQWIKGELYNTEKSLFELNTGFMRTDFIKIDTNVDYILSNSENCKFGRICLFDENYNYLENMNNDDLLTSFKITNTKAKYIIVNIFYRDYPNLSWIQLEQGTTATPYEAYIKKKIYIKNETNKFETVYEESENVNKIELKAVTPTSNFGQIDVNRVIINNKMVEVNFRGYLTSEIASNTLILSNIPTPRIGSDYTNTIYIGGEYDAQTAKWVYITSEQLKGEYLPANTWVHISLSYIKV